MTPQQATDFLEYQHAQLVSETQITRRILAAVPDEQSEYRPHATCMSAADLVRHIAFVEIWFLESIQRGEFAAPDDSAMKSLKPSEVTEVYNSRIPDLISRLKSLSGEQLAAPTKFYTFELPLVQYLDFCQKHSAHHRGQLSVYLRPMGAKVPSIYGGSADEPMTAASNA